MYDLNYIINNSSHSSNNRAEGNAGRNSDMNNSKKDLGTFDFGSNNANWLPGLVDVDNKLHCILILKYNMLKILVKFKFPKDN